MKYKECPILLRTAPGEVLIANSLIKRFKEQNKVDFDLTINIDFLLEDSGVYIPSKKHNIYVNPDMAMYTTEDDAVTTKSYHGYINDCSLLGNVMHEFGHFLCYEPYNGIVDEYKKDFPIQKDRLYLCAYSNETIDEEMAEIIRLYFLNPLLLKLINEKTYKFFRKKFKSPSPTSQRHTIQMVDDFPITIKNELYDKWNIAHDVNIDKIIKVG